MAPRAVRASDVGRQRRIIQYGCKSCPDLRFVKKKMSASEQKSSTVRSVQRHVEQMHPEDKDEWEKYAKEEEPKWSVRGARQLKKQSGSEMKAADTHDNEDDGGDEDEGEEEEEGMDQQMVLDSDDDNDMIDAATVGTKGKAKAGDDDDPQFTAFDLAAIAGDYGLPLAHLARKWQRDPKNGTFAQKYKSAKADVLDGKYRDLLNNASDLIKEKDKIETGLNVMFDVVNRIADEQGMSEEELLRMHGATDDELNAIIAVMQEDDEGADEEDEEE